MNHQEFEAARERLNDWYCRTLGEIFYGREPGRGADLLLLAFEYTRRFYHLVARHPCPHSF